MWRCRNSAAANRRALHSEYTSAMKKTPTPLNGAYTRAQKPSDFAQRASRDDDASALCRSMRADIGSKKQDAQKPIWNRHFARMTAVQLRVRARTKTISLCAPQSRKTQPLCRLCPSQKNFPQRLRIRHCGERIRSKTSESSVARFAFGAAHTADDGASRSSRVCRSEMVGDDRTCASQIRARASSSATR
jgi:hypothetical protein